MSLMDRRRALMAEQKKERIRLVDGIYRSTTTVSGGNHINMNPLVFNKFTRIPLNKPVHVHTTVAMKRDGDAYNKTVGWYAIVDDSRIWINRNSDKPYSNTWYQASATGTMTAIEFLGTTDGYKLDATYSIKIDEEVIL